MVEKFLSIIKNLNEIKFNGRAKRGDMFVDLVSKDAKRIYGLDTCSSSSTYDSMCVALDRYFDN